ncbi:MAG: anti-sigma factor [Chitinophagaceae bacterium]|nr:anti-sigma factor [Chitinophagaceae bacterium]
MNVNDYILSGILEQYVLGDVSPQEKQEVECMSHIYPEIKEELIKVEKALEGFAMDNAVTVPYHIKKNIFDLIEQEEKSESRNESSSKVVPINTDKEVKVVGFNYKKYLVAASVLFIISLSGLYLFMNANKKSTELAMSQQIENLTQDKIALEESYKNQLAALSIQNNKIFVLQGNTKAPGKTMVVAWNTVTGNVYVNNIQLPSTPADKQYQLWALKDGKPIDLGVFDVNTNLQNMKNVQGAQAFAVTLEKKGGSPTPNLEELYAIVNI